MARPRGIKQRHPLGSVASRSGISPLTVVAVSSASTGVKISELPAASAASATDLVEVSEAGSAYVSKRVTLDQVATLVAASDQISDVLPFIDVRDFGAVGDGVTDDAAAIQAAIDDGTTEVVVPPGTYRCASGIVVPEGVTLRGLNFQPDNPPTNYGSVLLFDNTVPTCVTLAGATLQACSLRGITVARAGATPPAGSIGVLVTNGYNITIVDVMPYNHAIGFKFLAAAPGGLGAHCDRLFSGAISDAHIVYDTWAELYVQNSRFGMCGTGNLDCNSYIRVQGGNPGTGAGPNSLHFTNCQFNQGGGGSPDYFCDFVDLDGTIGGSPNTDGTEFVFTSCHVENVATAYFHSDATWNRLQYFYSASCSYHSPGIPFLALNAATELWSWHIVGNAINGPITLTPPLFAGVVFVGNDINGNVSLTGASGSFASFIGNNFATLTLAGAWSSLVVDGGTVSTLANTATGSLSISIPGVAGGHKRAGPDSASSSVFSGATKGIRLGFDSAGSYIEGVDSTGTGSFQPLTLNGTAVGITAPLTGTTAAFSTEINLTGSAPLNIKGAAGTYRQITFQTGSTNRWTIGGADNIAESGSNVGSDFGVHRFDDAGGYLGLIFTISRSTGAAQFYGQLTSAGSSGVGAGANTQAFIKASSTPNLGLFYGTGNPSFGAAKGSLYTKTDATTTTTRLWVNTDGGTTWANFTSSA